MRKHLILAPLLAAILHGTIPTAHAVINALSSDSQYTQTPTTDDFGFGNVGWVFNTSAGIPSSGVYLGNGWMITAYHNLQNGSGGFVFGSIYLGGVGYTADSTTATRLHNSDLSLTDLALFRLTTVPPDLLSMTLSGSAPSINTSLRLAGNGQDRESTETRWLNVASSWTEVTTGGNRSGYKLLSTRALRWGTNTVETAPALTGNLGFGNVTAFSVDFDQVSGEAMATGGDSGGGVFWKNGSTWELGGIMLYTGGYSGQPGATAIYGNSAFAANIATYRTEIQQIIATPEPSSAILLLMGAGLATRRRRL